MTGRCVWAPENSASCPFNASQWVGGIALCSRHYIDLKILIEPPPLSPAFNGGVVYYLGDPTAQQVKIGYSADLKKRVGSHRSRRPGSLLLAFEPGPMKLERERHRQFRSLRVPDVGGEREWFRKTPVLMNHVSRIRSLHGMLIVPAIPQHWIAPVRLPRDGPGPALVKHPAAG